MYLQLLFNKMLSSLSHKCVHILFPAKQPSCGQHWKAVCVNNDLNSGMDMTRVSCVCVCSVHCVLALLSTNALCSCLAGSSIQRVRRGCERGNKLRSQAVNWHYTMQSDSVHRRKLRTRNNVNSQATI